MSSLRRKGGVTVLIAMLITVLTLFAGAASPAMAHGGKKPNAPQQA